MEEVALSPSDLTLDIPNLDVLALETHPPPLLPRPPLSLAPQPPQATYKDGQENQVPGEMPPERKATEFRGAWGCQQPQAGSPCGWGGVSAHPHPHFLEAFFSYISMCSHLSVYPPPTSEVLSEGRRGRPTRWSPERGGALRGVHSAWEVGSTGTRVSGIWLMFSQVAGQAIVIPGSGTAGQDQVGCKEHSAVRDR